MDQFDRDPDAGFGAGEDIRGAACFLHPGLVCGESCQAFLPDHVDEDRSECMLLDRFEVVSKALVSISKSVGNLTSLAGQTPAPGVGQ